MKNNQYSIGEFASINKVSTRMLRHYDKIGLLQPTCILPNGYRCYSETQIGVISRIKQLRGCGFLLDEIDAIMQNENPHFLAEQSRHKFTELQGQAVQKQTEIQALIELMQENIRVTPSFIYGVSRYIRHGANLLTPKKTLTFDDVENAFDRLFRLLNHKNLCPTGCAVLLNYINSHDENQNQVGVPISEPYSDEAYQTLQLSPTSVLSVIHYGDYYNIGYAYDTLLKYAEQYGYSFDDTIIERYYIDSSHGANPNEYVTEVSVTLKNTP